MFKFIFRVIDKFIVTVNDSENDFDSGCRISQSQPKNSPYQDYKNPDNLSTTNVDSPESQPTTVLLTTTQTRTIYVPQTLTHLGLNQQQSFSGPTQNPDDQRTTNMDSPGSQPTTVPSHDYTNPDDLCTANIDPPGSQPTTVPLRTTKTRTIYVPQT